MKTLEVWQAFEQSGFFAKMREKLFKREGRNSDVETIESIEEKNLITHLRHEMVELASEIEWLKSNGYNKEKVMDECADVANMCAFVYAKLSLPNKEVKNNV